MFIIKDITQRDFPDGPVVKNLTSNEGVARDAGSTPQSGRSPEEEMATHSSIISSLENYTNRGA